MKMNLKTKTSYFIEQVLEYIFPVKQGYSIQKRKDIVYLESILLDLICQTNPTTHTEHIQLAKDFIDHVPEFKSSLEKDVEAIYEGDPAAKSKNEIIIAYPGFLAVSAYRFAHFLFKRSVQLLPRLFTEYAHSQTGIDIHPGAEIGESFCIDHGTGIVIGETTLIGNKVKIYQGVTLGALSVPDRNACPAKRHPTIEDNVVIYAQAIVLGGDTIIGANSVIGGNVWLTESVPAGSKVIFNNSYTNNFINKNKALSS